MQDLLSQLSPPIAIGLIVAGVLALVIVVLLSRRLRRRQAPPEESSGGLLTPGLGGPVDYTSLPMGEEPSGWRERFANLSIAGKVLVILIPILAVLGLVVLALTLLPGGGQPGPPLLPTTETVSLTVTKADVIRAEPVVTIGIAAQTTGLPDGTEVAIELQADGQPLAYLRAPPADQPYVVRRGRVEVQAQRADGAPLPQNGVTYRVVVRTLDGQAGGDKELGVPPIYTSAFYGAAVAVAPTPTTAAPTAAPTEVPATPVATAEVTATVAPELPSGPPVTVGNGGNVRRWPIIAADNVVANVDANTQVQVIARTPNGLWYRIRTAEDVIGWVSGTLLTIDATTTVPVANVVSVFTSGALYEGPDASTSELDRVNTNEVVELTQKSAAGDWYAVVNVRDIVGWVPASLLGIPPEVAANVPVAP